MSYTVIYMRQMMPTMLFLGLNDLQSRWLQIMNLDRVLMRILVFQLLTQIFGQYVFVVLLEMDLAGITLSSFISFSTSWLAMLSYQLYNPDIVGSLQVPISQSFKDWSSYLNMGLPVMGVTIFYMISAQFNLILAAQLGIAEIAAQAILIQFGCLSMQITAGV